MKRRLLMLAIFLLLGAVVNVAVAWGIAIWQPLPSGGAYRTFETGTQWPGRTPKDWPLATFVLSASSLGITTSTSGAGTQSIPGDRDSNSVIYRYYLAEFGIPLRTMEGGALSTVCDGYERMVTEVGRIQPIPAVFSPASPWRWLPLRPIWPGVAINTAFYAALLWLVIPGPFTLLRHIRRIIRRMRGLCVACGYDLRGDLARGCPECGWRREAEG